jgi:hypothetical protein
MGHLIEKVRPSWCSTVRRCNTFPKRKGPAITPALHFSAAQSSISNILTDNFLSHFRLSRPKAGKTEGLDQYQLSQSVFKVRKSRLYCKIGERVANAAVTPPAGNTATKLFVHFLYKWTHKPYPGILF